MSEAMEEIQRLRVEVKRGTEYGEFMNTQTKELNRQLDEMTEARDRFCGSVNRLAEIVGLSEKQSYAPEAVERQAKFELATLRGRVEELEGKRFPIQGGPSIPWRMILPHDRQCRSNHSGQDLERIAERKGLSPAEALCVLDDQSWTQSPWGNFMNDAAKSKSSGDELERRRAAFEDETVTLQARVKALEKEVETVNVNWDADRAELEEALANTVPLAPDEGEVTRELLMIVHAIVICDEKPLPGGLCQCTRYIGAQFEGLRAEVKRLQAKVQYAKDFGLEVGVVKSSDCPEGRLGANTTEGSELQRLERGIADLIEAELKIKTLLEDPDSEVGRLKKAAVECCHRVLGCPVVTPDEVDLLDPTEAYIETAPGTDFGEGIVDEKGSVVKMGPDGEVKQIPFPDCTKFRTCPRKEDCQHYVPEGNCCGRIVYRCKKCKGTNVQHARWVRLNSGEVLDDFGSWCNGDNNWCGDCAEHTDIDEEPVDAKAEAVPPADTNAKVNEEVQD